MKICYVSYRCPYGNAFEENLCAYTIGMEENDPCPFMLENSEEIIDKIIKKEIDDERH